MTRRTYHLPPHIDHALARHASKLGTNPSVIVREALSSYLAIDGIAQRMSLAMDAIRQEQHACLLMMKELRTHLVPGDKRAEANPVSDRVRARFDQIINKE